MALKGDRQIIETNIRFVCNSVAEAGKYLAIASQPTGSGVGIGLGDSATVVTAVTGTPASGTIVAGLLLSDFVNIDPTRQHRNWQKTEQLVGEPAPLLTDGFVWTNAINGTPAPGDTAFPGPSGNYQNTITNAIPSVGKFWTSKDTDGYALVSVKIV